MSDVAEALHCTPAEIEALVWRARAEGVKAAPTPLQREIPVRGLMIGVLVTSIFLCVLANALSHQSDTRTFLFACALWLFCGWLLYASICVLLDAFNRKK